MTKENSVNLIKEIDKVLDDCKAQEISKINVSGKSSLCDYFYIATGTSSRHVQSIADNLVKHFKNLGLNNVPKEGSNSHSWIALDLGDAIIHIFQKDSREDYKLEELWK